MKLGEVNTFAQGRRGEEKKGHCSDWTLSSGGPNVSGSKLRVSANMLARYAGVTIHRMAQLTMAN